VLCFVDLFCLLCEVCVRFVSAVIKGSFRQGSGSGNER
jgi:hypothetical protein